MGSSGAALVFILVFYALMILPCVGIGWIGYRLIDKLGRFPSKTPSVQLGVMYQLIIVEVVSLTLILVFFKVLVTD